jgi:hypothetical protein
VAFFDYDKDVDLDVFVTGRPVGQVGRGIAVADIDNDGWPDLLVTNLFGRKLYRNNGDGTFTDVTQNARRLQIETIKIDGGKVEITGDSIRVEGGKVEIIRRKP